MTSHLPGDPASKAHFRICLKLVELKLILDEKLYAETWDRPCTITPSSHWTQLLSKQGHKFVWGSSLQLNATIGEELRCKPSIGN